MCNKKQKMKKIKIYQVDSFTKEKFKGNPAGVVLNADGLSDKEMQQVARELNNSETAFLLSSNDDRFDVEIRYFTPTLEVPICGHATIAALYSKATEENLDTCTLKIKTKIGILPIEIEKQQEDYLITMTQGSYSQQAIQKEEEVLLLSALGISKTEQDLNCPIRIASTGHSKVLIGIKSRKKLNELNPNQAKLTELSKRIKCNGYFVFTFDAEEKDILTYGRMFAPAIGITEDPVTGNANGPLGGYLVVNKLVDTEQEQFEFIGAQGEQMQRFGKMKVLVKIDNKQPVEIKIQGNAIVVFKTEITL